MVKNWQYLVKSVNSNHILVGNWGWPEWWGYDRIPCTQYSGSAILSHGRITLRNWARLCDCFWPMNWKQEWFVSLQDPAPNCFWELPFPCVMAGIAQGSSCSEAWLADGLHRLCLLSGRGPRSGIKSELWVVDRVMSSQRWLSPNSWNLWICNLLWPKRACRYDQVKDLETGLLSWIIWVGPV